MDVSIVVAVGSGHKVTSVDVLLIDNCIGSPDKACGRTGVVDKGSGGECLP